MDLDLKLDGVKTSDIIAVRQFYSGIAEICYNAGLEIGDLDAARAAERVLINKVRSGVAQEPEHMTCVVQYILNFIGGKYNEYAPQEVLAGLDAVISKSVAN